MIRKQILGSALALGAVACGGGPETGGGNAFDGAVAYSLVERQIEFGPRVPGTEAHQAALAWLEEYLSARADSVELHTFRHVTTFGDSLELTNLFARINAENPNRVLLLAHWDSRPVAEMDPDSAARRRPVPGANDGASGVAVLLALADVYSRTPPAIGVDILLTDGEDWGYDPVTLATVSEDMLLGSRHFASTIGMTYRPLYGILLDLVGDRDPAFPYEGNSMAAAPEVVTRVWNAAADLGYEGMFLARPGPALNDDHIPLIQAGIHTIDIIDFDYPFWHTTQDTPDKVSAQTLDAVGEVLYEVIRRQGPGR